MDLSTFLKFAGILVSGALGILGTITETHDKKGHLTTWGRIALLLTVAGLTVAFFAQVFDTVNQINQERESRKKTAELLQELKDQSDLTNQSLEGIKRVATHFNQMISFTAVYEFPADDPQVKQLLAYLSGPVYLKKVKSLNFVPFPEGFIAGSDFERHVENNSYLEFSLDDVLNTLPPGKQFQGTEHLLLALKHPLVELGLNKINLSQIGNETVFDRKITATDPIPKYVVIGTPVNHNRPIRRTSFLLCYATPSNRMFIEWNFEIPAKQSDDRYKIVSLHDLADSYCYSSVSWDGVLDSDPAWYNSPTFQVLEHMRPVAFDLKFDDFPSITLKNFRPIKGGMESRFPTESSILDGSSSSILVP